MINISTNKHELMSSVGWCDDCNVPIIDAHECGICGSSTRLLKVGKGEVKPVFDSEKKWYLEILYEKGYDGHNLMPEGLCFYNRGAVIVDGKKVFRILYDEKEGSWNVKLFRKYVNDPVELSGSDPQRVIKANEKVLKQKEQECIDFLSRIFEEYKELPKAVSISGGKDSTVALALTRQLNHRDLDAVFLNTTLAFPETVQYVYELAKLWNLRLLEAKPTHDFFELCEQLGPPSRFMKWCCKTQKFGPLNGLIREEYSKGVLVVSGLRRTESRIRTNFKRVQRNEKIPKQLLVFPIIDWSSLAVWLYLFWKKIPYNKEYENGFSRIGCWACPEKSLRKAKMIERNHPELTKKLYLFLERYAEENGFDKNWVYDGKWRLRATKYSRVIVCTSKACSLENELLYSIKEPEVLDRAKEFLKVFGESYETRFMTKILGSDIEISIIGNNIRVAFEDQEILELFERQLKKALNCVGCGACLGACNHNALKIEDGRIRVTDKCKHCLNCVNPKGLRMGCVSLNYKPVTLSIAKSSNN